MYIKCGGMSVDLKTCSVIIANNQLNPESIYPTWNGEPSIKVHETCDAFRRKWTFCMNGNSYMGMEGLCVFGTCLYQGLTVILQLPSL